MTASCLSRSPMTYLTSWNVTIYGTGTPYATGIICSVCQACGRRLIDLWKRRRWSRRSTTNGRNQWCSITTLKSAVCLSGGQTTTNGISTTLISWEASSTTGGATPPSRASQSPYLWTKTGHITSTTSRTSMVNWATPHGCRDSTSSSQCLPRYSCCTRASWKLSTWRERLCTQCLRRRRRSKTIVRSPVYGTYKSEEDSTHEKFGGKPRDFFLLNPWGSTVRPRLPRGVCKWENVCLWCKFQPALEWLCILQHRWRAPNRVCQLLVMNV